MKKFSTTFLVFAFIAAVSLLAGCNGSPNGNTAYDSTYYNVSMRDALQASQAFVKESVKKSASRSAFVDLEEEDTWQGYIGTNWNVPSSIYGTSLTTADNELVINGENLGTLQELVFHKDEEGHFTKAVFEYKGNLYYVMDDQDGRFVVLSSEDDYDHIFFTQDGKAFTKDWSNFKIWTWVKAGDGKLYRNGNLGYAYTLRNVQMLDGSYATITVSGFNYYNYGFRVWIKETDGNTVKKDYPADAEVYNPDYEPSVDMSKYFSTSDANCDFVFEIKNKKTVPIIVSNFIKNANVNDSTLAVVTKTEDYVLAPGETKIYKYTADKILADFDENYVFCNYCYEQGAQYHQSAWYSFLYESNIKGQKIYVEMTDSSNNGGEKHAYFSLDFVSQNTFTVNEWRQTFNDNELTDDIKANYPKDQNGRYYCYIYNISDYKDGYIIYYNSEVYYPTGTDSFSSKFPASCKSQIETMLNAGNFTEKICDYCNVLALNSNPL